MGENIKKNYLKIGSFLAALNFSCSALNVAQATPIVIQKSNGSSAKTFLSMSLPIAILALAGGGFALNEYYGSQGHPWTHPLWLNKGIKAINKNGISKNEIKDEEEEDRIRAFFGKSAETPDKIIIDVLKTYNGKSIKEIFSKFKPQFTIKASDEKKENNNLCVIVRNLTSGKNYIGIPGSYPYSNLVEMWKTICDENTKIENFDDKEINENKLHPIFNFIYGLKQNFGVTNFGNAKIKFLFHSFKDEKVGNAKPDVVSSVVITKNNKEKSGILEIRLDFEKQNGDKPVSVSFYSPCSWEKEPAIVPIIEKKPNENDEQKAGENEEKKLDGKKKDGLFGWGWTIKGFGF